MTNFAISRKVQVVKHLEVIRATTEKNIHFIFPFITNNK